MRRAHKRRAETAHAINRVRFELNMLYQMIGWYPVPQGEKAKRRMRYYRRFFRPQAQRDVQYRLI